MGGGWGNFLREGMWIAFIDWKSGPLQYLAHMIMIGGCLFIMGMVKNISFNLLDDVTVMSFKSYCKM